jgi:hypothetical protein
MRKFILKMGFCNLRVQRLMDLHGVLVLLKDLPKTTNTVWYFHAQIKIMKNGQYLQQRSK